MTTRYVFRSLGGGTYWAYPGGYSWLPRSRLTADPMHRSLVTVDRAGNTHWTDEALPAPMIRMHWGL